MMRKIYFFSFLIFLFQTGKAQELNMDLLGQLEYSSDLSDIWGYVDGEGTEYALVGVNNPGGVSVVDLSDPANPAEVAFIPDASSIWRDIKTWGTHAYATNENGQGLLIIDLSSLPDASGITSSRYTGPTGDTWSSAHNIFIDEFGYAYIFGASRDNGGAIMLDLTDRDNPLEVGTYETAYIHDGMAKNNIMYSGHVYNGTFSVVDVSDKANPVYLGGHETPSEFTHNVWVNDDGTHVYTTDEVSGGYLTGYNISDLNDIVETDRVQANPGSNTIIHNAHYLNDYVITSYYKEGVTIHDVSDPENIVLTGQWDTSPFEGDGFAGAWGAYPFLPSGLVLVSDIEEGLFVFQPTYVRAARIQGQITDATSTNPIFDAEIVLISTVETDQTDVSGNYKLGVAEAGMYSIMVSKFGYASTTIDNVELVNGEVVNLGIEMEPSDNFTLLGQVNDTNGNGVSGAFISFENEFGIFEEETDEFGQFQFSTFFEGNYSYTAAAWGYKTACDEDVFLSLDEGWPLIIELGDGIQDDFTFDFGWSVQGNANTGMWERAEPIGTDYNGQASNPGSDLSDDCGSEAYVTGNGGGGAGTDDVDFADTWLISPIIDASIYVNPQVSFNYWFFNDGGNGPTNDSLSIFIRDGINNDWVFVTHFTQNAQWELFTFTIEDYINNGSSIQIGFKTSDYEALGGHLVEAGIDNFEVLFDELVGVSELNSVSDYKVYPNPAKDHIYIEIGNDIQGQLNEIYISDITGKRVFEQKIAGNDYRIEINPGLDNGTYILNLIWSDDQISTNKILILE